jgi:hypothetical protein
MGLPPVKARTKKHNMNDQPLQPRKESPSLKPSNQARRKASRIDLPITLLVDIAEEDQGASIMALDRIGEDTVDVDVAFTEGHHTGAHTEALAALVALEACDGAHSAVQVQHSTPRQ